MGRVVMGIALLGVWAVCSATASGPASSGAALSNPAESAAPKSPNAASNLDEIVVTSERMGLIGTATTSSQGVVVNDELALKPQVDTWEEII
jgi:hypothetical protein